MSKDWVAVYSNERWSVQDGSPIGVKYGLDVCVIYDDVVKGWEEQKKVAHLLAAAPELLEACQFALEVMKLPRNETYFSDRKAIEKLEKAIEKVKEDE